MKDKLYKLLIFSFVIGSGFSASAQVGCGTTEAERKLFEQHPELSAAFDNYNSDLNQLIQSRSQQRTGSTVFLIPVVFHIIHENGVENISDAQIFDQMTIMNKDWRKLNSDTAGIVAGFNSHAADVHIEFRLAQIDPNGNCTNGIDRIYSHKTNGADDGSKLNGWPRNKYLNIWIVKSMANAGAAGYAYYPSDVAGQLFPYDGVIMLHDYIGSIGTGSVGKSRTLTHEIAHCFSLQHVWGSTNDPGVSCGDDQVYDTPATKGHTTCSTDDLYGHVCSIIPFTSVIYKFDSVTTTSGTTDPTPSATTDNVLLSSFIANGVSANSDSNGKFEFSNWGTGAANGATTFASLTGAINTGKYYQFTITPKTVDSSMTLTGISFTINRSATGPRSYAVRSSANAYASNLPATISPVNTNLNIPATTNSYFITSDTTLSQNGTKITLSGTAYTNKTTPITFRIYAYNAEDALGSFGIDSVFVIGNSGAIENTQNYMEYSYCSKMFTNGQRDRMEAALNSPVSGRNNLWTAANLIATGITTPPACVPFPDFYSDRVRVCKGDIVKFTKNITRATATSIMWTFEGGTPSTSISTTPVNVTYNTPGLYKVTLSATNAAGTDSIVKTQFIRVDEDWADIDYNGTYTESFQNTTNFYWDWQVRNLDNNENTWFVANTGYNSSKSVGMQGYGNFHFDVDELISPSYDLSFTSSNIMTFRCAGSSRGGSAPEVNEQLKVYISKDCGKTWFSQGTPPSWTFKDSTLINNGYQASYFTPNSASQWELRKVIIPATYNTDNVRFKFEYTTGSASNNIYIDDINISGAVGINENNISSSNLSIYPNPTNQTSTIAYHLEKKATTKIEIIDVLGKTVFVQSNNNQTEGDYSIMISKQNQNLRNGIYFVKFSIDNESTTKKLIITE